MKMPIAKVSPEVTEGQPKNIADDPIELARELAKQFTETAPERDDQGAIAWHELRATRSVNAAASRSADCCSTSKVLFV
jgi:hypothetical protein